MAEGGEDLTGVHLTGRARADAILEGQHQGFQKGPLVVRQIGRVGLPGASVHQCPLVYCFGVTSCYGINRDRTESRTVSKKGEEVVRRNFAAVDHTLAHLFEVPVPGEATSTVRKHAEVPAGAPDFVRRVTAVMMAGKGDLLPVSAFPVDGTWPLGTTKWEKRRIADEVPVWDPKVCIQCNKCAFVCPHATIRAKVYEPQHLQGAPADFQSTAYKGPEFPGWKYTIQVAPEDCTGCNLCVAVCPAKDKTNPKHKAINMTP